MLRHRTRHWRWFWPRGTCRDQITSLVLTCHEIGRRSTNAWMNGLFRYTVQSTSSISDTLSLWLTRPVVAWRRRHWRESRSGEFLRERKTAAAEWCESLALVTNHSSLYCTQHVPAIDRRPWEREFGRRQRQWSLSAVVWRVRPEGGAAVANGLARH